MFLDLKKVFANEDESIVLNYQLDISDVEFGGYYPFTTPINISGEVQNSSGIVSLNVKVAFNYCHPCDRCMSEVNKSFEYLFKHALVTENDNISDNDCIVLDEFKLDLDKLITDDLLLELPSKILCNDDCKGLCPNCGENLNEGSCDCAKHQVDPRLEVLKDLID